ncbi:MAG: hypothetical protein K2X35_01400 [Bryobacteraceae bacterium]|nr:hypothetical protein [Bryobacteraceae bacterium]
MPPELLAQQLASLCAALEDKPGSIEAAVDALAGLTEQARAMDLTQPGLPQLQREIARLRALVDSGRTVFDEWAARLYGEGYTASGERPAGRGPGRLSLEG